MNGKELFARIDAWCTARLADGWADASESLAAAIRQWGQVAVIYGVNSAPALGCLLALVREAWGESDAHAVMHRHPTSGEPWWSVASFRRSPIAPQVVSLAKSETEALANALEAAPL